MAILRSLVAAWMTTVIALGLLESSASFEVGHRPGLFGARPALAPIGGAAAADGPASSSRLFASTQPKNRRKKGYEPKWKKKKTLAEEVGDSIAAGSFSNVGIKGDIPVTFKQGNVTKTTMASVGMPLRDVAIQAGQFIKYGCGKGECGTCEAL